MVGVGHQRAADRQHLLLAARQQAGVLVRALLEDGEVAVHPPCRAPRRRGRDAGVGAHQQVVAHRQQREHLAPFGHMHQALLHDPAPGRGGDVLALEVDLPLRGSMMPEMVFRMVVLPAPLEPSTVAISPGAPAGSRRGWP
jgi:hypothetical protein